MINNIKWIITLGMQFAVGSVLTWGLVYLAKKHVSGTALLVFAGGLVSLLLMEIAKRAPDLDLVQLSPFYPGTRSLRRLGYSRRAYNTLLQTFVSLQEKLRKLQYGEELEENSYRDQMQIARCLYAAHESRFWATSLDPWSIFLHSNEDYIAAMTEDAADNQEVRHALTTQDPELPNRARMFVLRWSSFIRDIAYNETSARLLVYYHLKAWMKRQPGLIPIRVLLLPQSDDLTFYGLVKDGLDPAQSPVIPDFMIVDDKFIYGRVKPEEISDERFERRGVVLRYNSSKEVVAQYESLFRQLWQAALDPRELGTAINLAARGERLDSLAQKASTALHEFQATIGVLKAADDRIEQRFLNVMHKLTLDITEACNLEERRMRYGGLTNTADGARIVNYFAEECIERAAVSILAIDQADVKSASSRFWKKWKDNETYATFDKATRQSRAGEKRRIFIVKTLEGINSGEAYEFLKHQVEHQVKIGLIEAEELHVLALGDGASPPGSPEAERSSLPAMDSDFIIVDALQDGGSWALGPASKGFEAGFDDFTPQKIEYQNLLCSARIKILTEWFDKVWESPRCNKFSSATELSHNLEELAKIFEKRRTHHVLQLAPEPVAD